MPTLSREYRRKLENTVAQARAIAEEGARKVLADQYAVHHHEPWPHMTADDRKLRNQLRAHGRQLGDRRDAKRETQEIKHLVQACAYEHWHRMLFARFLAENDLLLDAQNGVAMALDDVRELAREQGRDWMDVAAELAQSMLLAVFRPDDPVLKVQFPPETWQQLEEKLASLPKQVFQADDSLGWVYQFWQSEEKDRINDSGVKIGADELPAVTELFTEDYMVWFLLHNTLGAWWTAKRKGEGKDTSLPGYEWTYLRLREDGMPAAGSFDGWPRCASDLKLLDPSMGSGHFLVFALPILVGFRMEEEGLTRERAVEAVLRDNLFGLEIDPRCTQIAAFNLAWTAWRMVGYRPLPQLNLACSGLGINAKEDDWVKLAGKDERARETMRRLYHLFEQAPVLGSLIDPKRVAGTLFTTDFEKVRPLLEKALEAEQQEDSATELAVTARGILQAAHILCESFTLIATNVPYLGRGKMQDDLRKYCDDRHPRGSPDLATCFVERCQSFTTKGCTSAVVTPQAWLALQTYKQLREHLLGSATWSFSFRVGTGAFDSISGEVVNVALTGLTNANPDATHLMCVGDCSDASGVAEKASALRGGTFALVPQRLQSANPDSRITFHDASASPQTLLSHRATSHTGLQTGDNDRYSFLFWELPRKSDSWDFFQRTAETTALFSGCIRILRWEHGRGSMVEQPGSAVRGLDCVGKHGLLVHRMSDLPVTIYSGEIFDQNGAVLLPIKDCDLPALWCYLESDEYRRDVRRLDRKLGVTPATLVQVPFDLPRWQTVAAERYPTGLPQPYSGDPRQWIFNGHPSGSENPLHIAVARSVGYCWPRQAGSSFMDCPALEPDGLEKHADADGIVPLNAIAGQGTAADLLRELLGEAYGSEWSAAKLQQLLGEWDSLEEWLRDGFFEEHCRIFHQRPFVWHIWDGRKDGFHALVNYHKLSAPNGEGRKTLEKLIYTCLGRWIERQTDEVRNGKEGADARFTAATHLKAELEKILKGEKPYDVFVRWKPLHEQPFGWEPDINDGVRLNIRPWLTAKVYQPTRRDGCILRVAPRIPYGKDRGKEPHRAGKDFPWFWTWDEHSDDFPGGNEFDGARWNDLHYSLAKKKEAQDRQKAEVAASAKRKS
jgi:hypothetical protein